MGRVVGMTVEAAHLPGRLAGRAVGVKMGAAGRRWERRLEPGVEVNMGGAQRHLDQGGGRAAVVPEGLAEAARRRLWRLSDGVSTSYSRQLRRRRHQGSAGQH
ncbi:MAG: hypothetical protein ACXVDA_05995 [Ktedonobacterales bacterium]